MQRTQFSVLPILFLSILCICYSVLRPLSTVVSADAPIPFELPAEEKLIAITFDDGPHPVNTARLLDGLSERGVPATFFLIGSRAVQFEDLVLRMEADGHQIGIHTYDHTQLTALSRTDFDKQVEKTRALLKNILGHNDFLLRPPYGLLDDTVQDWAECPIILWSIDPEDWNEPSAQRVTEHIISHAEHGSIILLHDIYPESVDAALAAIDQLHAEGYHFVTVSDLFESSGIPLETGEVYRSLPS